MSQASLAVLKTVANFKAYMYVILKFVRSSLAALSYLKSQMLRDPGNLQIFVR